MSSVCRVFISSTVQTQLGSVNLESQPFGGGGRRVGSSSLIELKASLGGVQGDLVSKQLEEAILEKGQEG